MTKKQSAMRIADIVLNFACFVMVAVSVSMFFVRGGSGNMDVVGAKAFRYYTVDSNILLGVASLVVAISGLMRLRSGKPLPKAVVLLKFCGTCVVLITFFTVIVFLGPVFGFAGMYANQSLYLHGVVPVLAALTLLILERGTEFSAWESLLSLIPTALYGTVYFIMVLAVGRENGGWEDFYGFNMGDRWILSVAVMGLAAAGLALLLRALYRIGRKKK